MADLRGSSAILASVADVQELLCSGRLMSCAATTVNDPERVRAIKTVIRAGLQAGIAAVRTARLIDFGEVPPCRISGTGTEAATPPFGGEPTAYTFVVPESEAMRAARFLFVTAPRNGMCSAFEIFHTVKGPFSRWLSTSNMEEIHAESSGLAEAFDGAAWANDLAQLVTVSKLVSILAPADQNRIRRVRGLPPLPGYFKATLPPLSIAAERVELGGNHASPQPHLRRGHLRRLRDGRTVAVRPCSVRGGPHGVGTRLHTMDGGAGC